MQIGSCMQGIAVGMGGGVMRPPNISAAQREEMFKKVDKDGSGGISKDELATFEAEMAEKAPGRSRPPGGGMLAMFETADVDGNGDLSQTEMEDAHEAMRTNFQGQGIPSLEGQSSVSIVDLLKTSAEEDDGSYAAQISQLLQSLYEKSTSHTSEHSIIA